jgi:cytochrome b6-f complex iron-sulfur subunit
MMPGITRRSFAKAAFVGSVASLGVAGAATLVNMLYPRRVTRRNEVFVRRDSVPSPGEAPLFVGEGRFFLLNLLPGDGYRDAAQREGSNGLLALHARCSHLHCEVKWGEDYEFNGRADDRFVCPCHGGVFTKAGVRLFGPPPRSLDTLALRVLPTGDVVVDTAAVQEGDLTNPQRAVAWPPQT